ncbi:MAG: hypothetical protein BWY31_02766 [Lentisphaerae bacterium ADurb.Bin242]|nr:MAG: hypothetical protein BWY31_02766 [Lentisphaerae bacterium ADurb.Bin242]
MNKKIMFGSFLRFAAHGMLAAGCWTAALCGYNAEAAPEENTLVLSRNGKMCCNVVMPSQPELVEVTAGEELCAYLAKAAGAPVATRSTAPLPGAVNIYLGTVDRKELASKFAPGTVKALKGDGYALRAGPDGIYILGNNPNGVLYGVYGFLKKNIGLRWFHPGPDGEYCPSTPDIRIGYFEKYSNPSFAYRWPGGDLNRANSNEQAKWHVRNGLQLDAPKWMYVTTDRFIKTETMRRPHLLSAGGGHELSDLVCKRAEREKLFKEHPEYFGMFRGKRILKYWAVQPCLSNPEVFERIYQGVKETLMTYPRGGTHTIGTDDTPQFCECPECSKGVPPEEANNELTSTKFYTFVQKIKDRLKKERVPGQLNAWGYHGYVKPPMGKVRVDPSVRIHFHAFGHCHTHALDDPNCPNNVNFLSIIRAWQKQGISMQFNEVTSCLPQGCDGADMCNDPACHGVEYLPMERRTAQTLRLYRDMKVNGVTQFMSPYDITYRGKIFLKNRRNTDMPMSMWHHNYTLAQYLWDADTDFDTFFEDTGSKFYGPGWPAMKGLRLKLYDLFENGPHMFSGVPNEALADMLLQKPGSEKEIEALFEEAERLAAKDPLRLKRIKLERDYYRESIYKMFQRVKLNRRPDTIMTQTRAAIVPDGELDEAIWKKAPIVTDFRRTKDGQVQKPEFQVAAKALYDDEYLYLGIETKDPAAPSLAAYEKKPSLKIYHDAYLDIFIKAPDGGDFYYQITINLAGTCLEYKRNSGALGTPTALGVKVKTKVLSDRVCYEIAIPVKALNGANAPGKQWKINIGWAPRLDRDTAADKTRDAVCLGTTFHLSYMNFVCGKQTVK